MAASFNRVMLLGNLTRDPELRYTSGGTAIAQLGLAVNRRFRDRNEEWQDEVTFVDIEVWGRQAENCNEYLRKGRPVFVEGRLKFDQWEDKESGAKRSKLKVVGERIQFLSGDGDGGSGGGGGSSRGGSRGGRSGGRGSSRAAEPEQNPFDELSEDEVPF